MKPPRELREGERLTSSYFKDATRFAESLRHDFGLGLLGTQSAGATVIDLARRPPRRGAPTAARFPFQIYQSTPNPSSPAVSDWRTVRVAYGLVNNIQPLGDAGSNGYSTDGDPTHANLILPASSTIHVWLAALIVTGVDDPDLQGTIDTTEDFPLYVDFGTGGWSGFPNQPNGDPDTGYPPDAYYILLGDVVTGVDSPSTDPTYHQLTLPNPPPVQSSLGLGMFVWDFKADTTYGWIIRRRLMHWRA